jgi:transcriptional regulator GlxA family with amidase domain
MESNRYEKEIDGVVSYIQYHLDQPLSLSQIANYAGYSPYHFTRIFKEKIGVSPFYYISSLRMQQAKKMLLHTNFPVRDIGLNIGQQSLGTFTTQFTKRVGMTLLHLESQPRWLKITFLT